MPKETTYIYCDTEYAQIGAAMYIATICYPTQIGRRTNFVNACKAYICLRITKGKYKKRLFGNEEVAKFAKDKRKIDTQFNKAHIILEKRITAWRVFRLKLVSLSVKTQYNGKKFTIQQMLKSIFPTDLTYSADEHNKDNAFHRVWTPSKPIMHLIAGLNGSLKEKKRSVSIDNLIDNPEWVIHALKNSEKLRTLISLIPQLKIPDNIQIQLIPKDFS